MLKPSFHQATSDRTHTWTRRIWRWCHESGVPTLEITWRSWGQTRWEGYASACCVCTDIPMDRGLSNIRPVGQKPAGQGVHFRPPDEFWNTQTYTLFHYILINIKNIEYTCTSLPENKGKKHGPIVIYVNYFMIVLFDTPALDKPHSYLLEMTLRWSSCRSNVAKAHRPPYTATLLDERSCAHAHTHKYTNTVLNWLIFSAATLCLKNDHIFRTRIIILFSHCFSFFGG